MDVLSNPNWLNAMIIEATDRRSAGTASKLKVSTVEKVMFLANFIDRNNGNGLVNKSNIGQPQQQQQPIGNEKTDFLTGQHQLLYVCLCNF